MFHSLAIVGADDFLLCFIKQYPDTHSDTATDSKPVNKPTNRPANKTESKRPNNNRKTAIVSWNFWS